MPNPWNKKDADQPVTAKKANPTLKQKVKVEPAVDTTTTDLANCLRSLADFSVDPPKYRRGLQSAQAREEAYALLARLDG